MILGAKRSHLRILRGGVSEMDLHCRVLWLQCGTQTGETSTETGRAVGVCSREEMVD